MRSGIRIAVAITLACGLQVATLGIAFASPITFNFKYAQGPATATGFVTYESALISNTTDNDFSLPNPAVLALQVTVAGASAGNGTFGMGSFKEIDFDPHGGPLDFSRELVGQPTSGGTWGTPNGTSGDFNLFSNAAPAPNGVYFFVLGANHGAADGMTIVSVLPAPSAPVPMLDAWKLALLAALISGAGIIALRRARARV